MTWKRYLGFLQWIAATCLLCGVFVYCLGMNSQFLGTHWMLLGVLIDAITLTIAYAWRKRMANGMTALPRVRSKSVPKTHILTTHKIQRVQLEQVRIPVELTWRDRSKIGEIEYYCGFRKIQVTIQSSGGWLVGRCVIIATSSKEEIDDLLDFVATLLGGTP